LLTCLQRNAEAQKKQLNDEDLGIANLIFISSALLRKLFVSEGSGISSLLF